MNKVHGRTEIRQSENRVKKIRWVTLGVYVAVLILAVFGAVSITSSVFSKEKTVQAEDVISEDPNENIMIQVERFGSLDGEIITKEPEINYTVDDNFKTLDVPMDADTQQFVYQLCDSYNIDYCLVMALIKKESQFNPRVISPTNDYGLMQINKMNHKWLSEELGITDFLDARQNIRAGVFVLRKLAEEYIDVDFVLMAYNMGEDKAADLWKKGIYQSQYSRDVTQYQQEFYKELGVE